MKRPAVRLKNLLLTIGLLGFVGLYGYYLYRTREGLMHRGKYTIGYVTGSGLTVSSGWTLEYGFEVNGKAYTGSRREESKTNTAVGARYLVKYDSLSPDWHQVYYEAPVPDSIRRAPRNGWSRRPWPDPAHPAHGLRPAARPARDSAEAAMWREMDATQAAADSLDARARRAP